MRNLWIPALVGLLSLGASTVHAATCTVAGVTYTCEVMCIGTTSCNVETGLGHASCDGPLIGNGDGYCTICGDGSANNITGTDGADVICGKGGNDTINADNSSTGGDDIVSGDAGNDTIYAKAGNDLVLGGTGNDVISGGAGDDELDGEDGDDIVSGNKGNDVVRGGDGNDFLEGKDGGVNAPADIGDIICGGNGADLLSAQGSGQHCLDAGPDQTGVDVDCVYSAPSSPDSGDLATQRNCYDATFTSAGSRFCNCHDY